MKFVKGPDFPTGGIDAWASDGHPRRVRDRPRVDQGPGVSVDRGGQRRPSRIVVTELPYQVNKARLAEKIADLVKSGRIKDIADAQDHSSGRAGDAARDRPQAQREPARRAEPALQAAPQLQDNFGVIMLALVDGVPARR